jgi:hypothetical protein
MSDREPGFYWLKMRHDGGPRWEPAEWTVQDWGGQIVTRWWRIGDEVEIHDDDIKEIGERIPDHE